MSPAELLARETREWLLKAADDLGSGRVLEASGHEATALYHCQQAGEQSLKAWLTFQDQAFRKTHNLKELGDACARLDPSLTSLADEADALTDYAWKLRYPGAPYVVDPQEMEAMLTLAGRILAEVQLRLPPEARLT